MFENFHHTTPIQIRFKDVDKQGHVNNANHHTYVETARINYFADVLGRKIDWDENGLLLARVEMDYKEPVFLEEDIRVYSRVIRLGNKSFEMESIIAKHSDDSRRICAVAKSVVVCYNYNIKQTIEVPSHWREKFKAFEKNTI
jgi:acyl-CoA thioester hydrolase